MELVLSLFPGIDLLGRGFERLGFCVVRGPDLLWDASIEESHFPAGKFDGVIGGPPCQNYSDANRRRNTAEGDRLVGHFLRAIAESQPQWFLMENVRNVPDVRVEGYSVQRLHITDAECGGKQSRLRAIQFGSRDGSVIRPLRTEGLRPVTPAVLCRMTGPHDRHSRRIEKQGAPPLPLKSLTRAARALAIGNAVSFPMALTLAEAVAARSPANHCDCPCGCGRVTARGTQATASCRKRQQRRRQCHTRTIGPEAANVAVIAPRDEPNASSTSNHMPLVTRSDDGYVTAASESARR
ncbi:MAG: DNA cytosine methyltransferase [Planctomycetaceae bacterium]